MDNFVPAVIAPLNPAGMLDLPSRVPLILSVDITCRHTLLCPNVHAPDVCVSVPRHARE